MATGPYVSSRIPIDSRGASAQYALYYRPGVDAVVAGFPDLAVTARRA
ncbi:hypothetical protein SNL152K_6712 [Streptomyces sp. NL15-2K]|nr:hypothetical protein SNL152K_6712 [Streptomyces sp. NL15-2K]